VPSPTGYPVFLQDRKQPKFRGLVSLPTDAGHYLLAGLVEHLKVLFDFKFVTFTK